MFFFSKVDWLGRKKGIQRRKKKKNVDKFWKKIYFRKNQAILHILEKGWKIEPFYFEYLP